MQKNINIKKTIKFFVSVAMLFCVLSVSVGADAVSSNVANANIKYPLKIIITTDKTEVDNGGLDFANLKVKVTDSNEVGVPNINVKFGSKDGNDIIEPPEQLTKGDGEASFSISSHKEHISAFRFSLKDPNTGEIYSSNIVNISFLSIQRPSTLLNDISDFRSSPTTQAIADYVLTPVASAGVVAGASSSIINLLSSLFPYLNYLINLLLQFLGIRRKERPWGVIYDSMTKEPLRLATVRVFDAKTDEIVQTIVTDASGRFAFSPLGGKFYLTVNKGFYIFPSKLIQKTTIDGQYHELYFGGAISIGKDERVNISIPMDEKTAISANLSWSDKLRSFSEKVSLPVLVVSLFVALFTLWISTTIFNEILVLLYLLVIIFRKKIKSNAIQHWGIVFESKTMKAIAGVPIKVFNKKYNKLLETQISDDLGRFNLLLPKGEYRLDVVLPGYSIDHRSKEIGDDENYDGDSFKVENNEILRFNIPLKALKR